MAIEAFRVPERRILIAARERKPGEQQDDVGEEGEDRAVGAQRYDRCDGTSGKKEVGKFGVVHRVTACSSSAVRAAFAAPGAR
jgi:hypothetical protein